MNSLYVPPIRVLFAEGWHEDYQLPTLVRGREELAAGMIGKEIREWHLAHWPTEGMHVVWTNDGSLVGYLDTETIEAWSGLTYRELQYYMRDGRNRNQGVVCSCETNLLMYAGCKCGAIQKEREKKVDRSKQA